MESINNIFEVYEEHYQNWKKSTPEEREKIRNGIDTTILRIAEEELKNSKTPLDIFTSQAKFCYGLWLNNIREYSNINRIFSESVFEIFMNMGKDKKNKGKEEKEG